MRTQESPPLGKGTGSTSTNRKEKQMHTDSNLNSDELSDLITDYYDFYGMSRCVGIEFHSNTVCVSAHVDARFAHTQLVEHSGLHVLRSHGTNLQSALWNMLALLREAAPQFEDVAV